MGVIQLVEFTDFNLFLNKWWVNIEVLMFKGMLSIYWSFNTNLLIINESVRSSECGCWYTIIETLRVRMPGMYVKLMALPHCFELYLSSSWINLQSVYQYLKKLVVPEWNRQIQILSVAIESNCYFVYIFS